MNSRIQKLYVETTGKDWVYDFDPDYAETFADLIVHECVKVLDSMADPEDSERYFWAIQNAVTKIQEHFGVK